MTQIELIDNQKRLFENCQQIMVQKNNDYTGSSDALSNFKEINKRGVNPIDSFITVLDHKFQRLANLTKDSKQAENESTNDTILDLINYLVLFDSYLKDTNSNINSTLDDIKAEIRYYYSIDQSPPEQLTKTYFKLLYG